MQGADRRRAMPRVDDRRRSCAVQRLRACGRTDSAEASKEKTTSMSFRDETPGWIFWLAQHRGDEQVVSTILLFWLAVMLLVCKATE